MKTFETLNEYTDQLNGVTVLYPGGFKPLTGAHIDIIKRYLKHPNVKKVVLFVSPGNRDGIDGEKAAKIAKVVLGDLSVDVVYDKKSYSPVLAIYRWIENKERKPGKYTLASSSKGTDYQRVKDFVNNYENPKYQKNLPKGVTVIELPINVSPLTYKDGQPLSATRAREDIKNGNYKKFKESYLGVPEKKIQYIWNALVPKSTDVEEAGLTNFTVSKGQQGYSEIYPSQKYKSIKNVYEHGRSSGSRKSDLRSDRSDI